MKAKIFSLLALLISGAAFAQLNVDNPTAYSVCDSGNDYQETIDLTTKTPEILGSLNPLLYAVSYFTTQADAEANQNAITNPATYLSTGAAIYFRAYQRSNFSNYDTGWFGVALQSIPPVYTVPDMVMYEDPYDGVADFTLDRQNILLAETYLSMVTITFYATEEDAITGNTAAQLPYQFTNTSNPQTIYARVQYTGNGCFIVNSFNISVLQGTEPVVNIPDTAFLNKLIQLNADTNNDGQIQVSEAKYILSLNVDSSGITDLTGINAFEHLQWISATNNSIHSLNIDGLQHLSSFDFDDNGMTSLTLNNLPVLSLPSLANNNLTQIDLSTSSTDVMGMELWCPGNPNLTHINLKNGSNLYGYVGVNDTNGNNTTGLRYLCVNEGQIAAYQSQLAQNNIAGVQISSYCNFTPGGNYNTITGLAQFDVNGDGCDETDYAIDFAKVTISDGTNVGMAFSTQGNYTFYTGAGNFVIGAWFENYYYYDTTPPAHTINFPQEDGSVATGNFCVTALDVHNDAEVVIAPLGATRPGFDASYKIVYKNKGNQVLSGSVALNYDDTRVDFVSGTTTPDATATGQLTWNFTNLLPFENREIVVVFNTNGPTETPAVNMGDVLPYTVAVTTTATDDTPADNTYTLNAVVVNAYDPNNILCLEGATAPVVQIGEYLHYIVNFENTGNYPAQNIVVRLPIDEAEYELLSMELLNSSHVVHARVIGGIAEFIFENINLGVNGHGNILFKIKSNSGLVSGDQVASTAGIYFDYNYPIATNEAPTTFTELGTGGLEKKVVKVYPNPTTSIVNIMANETIQTIALYDIQGRKLEVTTPADTTAAIDLSARAQGVYLIKITTQTGVMMQKVIRE